MLFSDVIGQERVKRQLGRMLSEGHVPHALLFTGAEGSGKLPMAVALASRLLCVSPTPVGEPCGECRGCRMVKALGHPDLHFVYPVFKPAGQSSSATSAQFAAEWREQLAATPYFTMQQWLRRIGVENQQALIAVAETNEIVSRLATVSNQGGYRVFVVWQAELMNEEAANKLLKILEEPPAQTVFVLASAHPEKMLETIRSRTQRIDFPPIEENDMAAALRTSCGLQDEDARRVAHASGGSFTAALSQVSADAEQEQNFDMFVLLMRLCYMRKIKDLYEWAQQMAGWGRERQKNFLDYAQRMVRENFVYNFRLPELNYMSRKEADFAVRFARFINERNVIGISEEISAAQRDIAQNVNARMVFFDFALKLIVLLIQ